MSYYVAGAICLEPRAIRREGKGKVNSGRRLKFAILVLISQLLLIALAIAWVVHMSLIAANGAIYFIEANPMVLWAEIVATALITLFATAGFALEIYRLGERRRGDSRREGVERRGGANKK